MQLEQLPGERSVVPCDARGLSFSVEEKPPDRRCDSEAMGWWLSTRPLVTRVRTAVVLRAVPPLSSLLSPLSPAIVRPWGGGFPRDRL
jgi:hypothetical protein